VKAGGVSS